MKSRLELNSISFDFSNENKVFIYVLLLISLLTVVENWMRYQIIY